MQEVSKLEILRRISEKETSPDNVDARLKHAVCQSRSLYLFTLQDDASFLSLIWQESDGIRLLAPPRAPRTLLDVGKRLMSAHFTFEQLVSPLACRGRSTALDGLKNVVG
jgi:hypothetical protein